MVAALALVGWGVAAGLSGSIGGLASLFSYPALLALGLPATAANMTNTVALAIGSFGSVCSSRVELTGQRTRVWYLGSACAAGGAAGAGLLLITPPGVFELIVPFLVAGAALMLLFSRPGAHPVLDPDRASHGTPVQISKPCSRVIAAVTAVGVYGGYFGAAAGVMMLVVLLIGLPEGLARANALKNLVLGLANIIAAIGFIFFGPVSWTAVLPLTAGLWVGSWLGPVVVRRIPPNPLRTAIALAGIALAVKLGLDAYR